MMTHGSKEDAAPDAMQLVESSEGLNEFVPEGAAQPHLRPPEVRRSRANRVQQQPRLLWVDEAASREGSRDSARELMTAPVATRELTLGVGLDVGWGDPRQQTAQLWRDDAVARFGWTRLAGGVALGALVLSVAAAGIVMLRTSPPPTLADLSASAMDASRPEVSPPAVRDPRPHRAVTVDRRTRLPLEPALAGRASGVPPVSATAVRTQPVTSEGERPAAPGAPGAPVVAWLRPETEIRTAPSARADESADRPAPSAAAPAASLAPAAPADVPARGSVTTAPLAALSEAPPATVAPPPVTPPPAAASPSRAPELPRAASPDAPVAVVAAPSRREVDTRAIEVVLGRYRSAFNRLDASSASAVWPSVDEKSLAKAFERIENQNVSFDNCEIEIGGADAQADCRGTARYVPKVGSRTPRAEARRWRFDLRRTGDGWVIDQVAAR